MSRPSEETLRFFKALQPVELVEGGEYRVKWRTRRSSTHCVFKKVTEKGYAFVEKETGERFDKRLLYPSEYWEERHISLYKNSNWFNVRRALNIQRVKDDERSSNSD